MTTIDDKLKLFAKIVFEKVEKESEQKVLDFTEGHDQLVEEEKKNILKESENLIKQMKRKAETKKNQIISKANIDKQHALLKKRKEIFDRAVLDIRRIADDYTKHLGYTDFLEKCIKNCLAKINFDDIVIYFRDRDIENYGQIINELVNKYRKEDMKVLVEKTSRDIIGGCLCEDRDRTVRVDCSIASLIDDNKVLIGKMLMDNIQ